jgi:hypothetical protein
MRDRLCGVGAVRCLLISLLFVEGLDAVTITYRLDGFNPDPYAVFGRSVIDPSNGQRVTSAQMDGGRFVSTRTGGTWGGLFPTGDVFFSFCTEPRQFVSVGGIYTDEIVPLELGATNIGGMGSAKAERLRELFGRWLPDLAMPLTRLQSGALQIAVWEIVREDSGVLDVYSGDIYYYCVINVGRNRRDSRGAAEAGLERSGCEAWRWTADYAVRRARGEPRGWNWGGIRAARSSSRPARAEGEKRVRSITRNP